MIRYHEYTWASQVANSWSAYRAKCAETSIWNEQSDSVSSLWCTPLSGAAWILLFIYNFHRNQFQNGFSFSCSAFQVGKSISDGNKEKQYARGRANNKLCKLKTSFEHFCSLACVLGSSFLLSYIQARHNLVAYDQAYQNNFDHVLTAYSFSLKSYRFSIVFNFEWIKTKD